MVGLLLILIVLGLAGAVTWLLNALAQQYRLARDMARFLDDPRRSRSLDDAAAMRARSLSDWELLGRLRDDPLPLDEAAMHRELTRRDVCDSQERQFRRQTRPIVIGVWVAAGGLVALIWHLTMR
ncbi:MAG: hypothetical protein FJX75_19640 [Armatimonadetes bacterium]|nr:hypothetical protein [Armatimonadota bacterium]